MPLQGCLPSVMKVLVLFQLIFTVYAPPVENEKKKDCPLYPKVVVENIDCDLEIREMSKLRKYILSVDKATKLECLCNAQIKILSEDGKTEIGSGDAVMVAEITVYSKGEKKFITVKVGCTLDLKVLPSYVENSVVDSLNNNPQEALKRTVDAAMKNQPDIVPALNPLPETTARLVSSA